MRLRELFDAYDADGSGLLDAGELRRLVADLLPRATQADLLHFQVLKKGIWRCTHWMPLHLT